MSERQVAEAVGVGAVGVGIEYDRVAPAHWQAALDAIYPASDHLTSFLLRWEPGDPWQPIERWFIWQLRPVRFTRPDVLAELQGPHPRSTGHYCGPGYCFCRDNRWWKRWRDGTVSLIDRATWEVYRETGRYGVRFWTIQGDHGGHRHRLDTAESQIAKLKAGVTDTPKPGDLPYADFDLRTYYKVAEADRVRLWKGAVAYHMRSHDQMDADEAAVCVQAGELLWGWLESQVDRAADAAGSKGLRALRDAAPRVPWADQPRIDEDAIKQAVVTAGL